MASLVGPVLGCPLLAGWTSGLLSWWPAGSSFVVCLAVQPSLRSQGERAFHQVTLLTEPCSCPRKDTMSVSWIHSFTTVSSHLTQPAFVCPSLPSDSTLCLPSFLPSGAHGLALLCPGASPPQETVCISLLTALEEGKLGPDLGREGQRLKFNDCHT